MTLGTRMTLATWAAALLPILLTGGLVLRALSRARSGSEAAATAGAFQAGQRALEERAGDLERRVQAVARELDRTPQFRSDLPALARLAGLDALEVYDTDGRVVASAQFPEDAGRQVPGLPAALATLEGVVVARTRTPAESFTVLAQVSQARWAGEAVMLLGGVRLDDGGRVGPLAVVSAAAEPGSASGAIRLPYLDLLARSVQVSEAHLVLPAGARGGTPDVLRQPLVRALAAGLLLAAVLGMLAGAWARRPLADLVARAGEIPRPPQPRFDTREAELDAVSSAITSLEHQISAGSGRLRVAEERAAAGETARQVAHDLRNGLAPIHHVIRHLDEVHAREPGRLAEVYGERAGSIRSALAWLEALADGRDQQPVGTDAVALARQVATEMADRRVTVEGHAPTVSMPEAALHRVLANLVGNALHSLPVGQGTVQVVMATEGGGVRVSVRDTGRGMTRSDLERALSGGWTTRKGGSGTGLAVVRRLVEEAGGRLTIETEPGRGTAVHLDLSAAGSEHA